MTIRPSKQRRGDVYEAIYDNDLDARLLDGSLSPEVAADMLGVSPHTVRDSIRAMVVDEAMEADAATWRPKEMYLEMLGPMEAPKVGTEAYETFLDLMVIAFVAFRDEFFQLPSGKKFITSKFHRKWIRQVLHTIYTGGHSMILSPPRHGKSELLVHFCVWLTMRNPNIRMAWIGGNKEIASDMVGAVREHLGYNTKLVEAYLPKGKTFKPKGRASGEWQVSKFTVANRTVTGIKASTMVAIGRGGKILSRDCDFIICDDIEDHDSTLIQSARETTRGWFNQDLYSRKEDHTALFVIGSRQHTDDLYGYLLESEDFDCIVDTAHDEMCQIDPYDEKAHKDCLLFPELRSYKWLMQKKRSAEALGLPHIFEMVYLNRPRAMGTTLFVKDEIEQCFDPTRSLGIPTFPKAEEADKPNLRFVAGLDPAFTGYQAAFLWGYDAKSQKQWMCDIDNHLGGGILMALDIIVRWHETYQLKHWVIEDNLLDTAIRDDPRIVEYTRANDIYLEGHQTQMNKHDPYWGVTSFRRMYMDKMISLPTGDDQAVAMTNLYMSQLLAYSDENIKRSRRAKSDIVMASWFPMRAIRRWQKEIQAQMSVEFDEDFGGWEDLFAVNDDDINIW